MDLFKLFIRKFVMKYRILTIFAYERVIEKPISEWKRKWNFKMLLKNKNF